MNSNFKRVAFLSAKSFGNYDLLSRAGAVAIQTLIDRDADTNEFDFVSIGNDQLGDLLTQYADSTAAFLKQKHVVIKTSVDRYPPWEPDVRVHDLVVFFGELSYYPFKLFVHRAKELGIETLEY